MYCCFLLSKLRDLDFKGKQMILSRQWGGCHCCMGVMPLCVQGVQAAPPSWISASVSPLLWFMGLTFLFCVLSSIYHFCCFSSLYIICFWFNLYFFFPCTKFGLFWFLFLLVPCNVRSWYTHTHIAINLPLRTVFAAFHQFGMLCGYFICLKIFLHFLFNFLFDSLLV